MPEKCTIPCLCKLFLVFWVVMLIVSVFNDQPEVTMCSAAAIVCLVFIWILEWANGRTH